MLPFIQHYHMMYYNGRFEGEAGQDGSRQEGLEGYFVNCFYCDGWGTTPRRLPLENILKPNSKTFS